MKIKSCILSLIFVLTALGAFSQATTHDSLFRVAKTKAFDKNYTEARNICYRILKSNNQYRDARVLIGRTFAWNHDYDSARFHLKMVLQQDPNSLDAYLALIDAETWSNNCSAAIVLCDSALVRAPGNYDLLIKRTKACLCAGNISCARQTIGSLTELYPMNAEVQELLTGLRQGAFRNRIVAEHTFEFFREPYVRRWHVTSIQYQRDVPKLSFVAKVNAGQLIPADVKLFHPGDVQFEADVYPVLGKGYYAYLNYGVSEGELFPKHRSGVELFKTLPHGMEVSLGARYLYFNDSTEVWVYTGSFSKYIRSWWFSFRPYFSRMHEELYQSYFLFGRKYHSTYDYVGGMLGYGISPDLFPNAYGIYEVYDLNSYQLRIDIQHRLGTRLLFRSLTGYAYDQYAPDTFRHRLNLQFYLGWMF